MSDAGTPATSRTAPFFVMVAQHSDNPPRGLSAEVHAALETALRFHARSGSAETLEVLTGALQAAGRDARARELRSDELLLIFKAIEHNLGIGDRETGWKTGAPGAEAMDRSRLVHAMLEAYYLE